MSKDWFMLGRMRRRVTAGPHPSATLDESTPSQVVTPEPPREASVASIGVVTEAPAQVKAPEESGDPAAITLARGRTTRRLSSGPLPTYVDTRTATDWLAALADISAVTSYKALSYNLLDLKPGQTVADVGCGIGDDARALVEMVRPYGKVIGLDTSEAMIERAVAAGSAPGLRFVVADAASLPLEDGNCDAVRADRMLQHVEDPLGVLLEMRRILKPGGRLVVVEPDWKTMALYPGSGAGGDDDRAAQAIFDWQVAHTRRPLIGRQLRALLDEAGFAKVAVTPIAYSTTRFMEADLVLELTRAAESAARQWPNRLSPDEARAWRTTARAADAAGHFFASVPLFFGYGLAE